MLRPQCSFMRGNSRIKALVFDIYWTCVLSVIYLNVFKCSEIFRTVRFVDQEVTDKHLSDDQVENSLLHLFRAFKCSDLIGKVTECGNEESMVKARIRSRSYYDVSNQRKELPVNVSSSFNDHYKKQSESHQSTEYVLHKNNLEILRTLSGFTVERKPSTIEGAGMGVFVTSGSIPSNTIAALYPGI